MQEKEPKSRTSFIQRSILITLYLLSQKQAGPFRVADLRRIINKSRNEDNAHPIQVSNFSVSCKTLLQRGLLHKYRDNRTLHVAYRLTEAGLAEAEVEYQKMVDGQA